MAGTLPYIAPELLDGGAPTKRSDLYAIGAVIYEAVHGKPPYNIKGNDIAGFVAAVRDGRRARPALPAGFSEGTRAVDRRPALPDPADRPSSAIDALARLNEACRTKEPLETTRRPRRALGLRQPVGRDDELAALRARSRSPTARASCGCAGTRASGKIAHPPIPGGGGCRARVARARSARRVFRTPPGVRRARARRTRLRARRSCCSTSSSAPTTRSRRSSTASHASRAKRRCTSSPPCGPAS